MNTYRIAVINRCLSVSADFRAGVLLGTTPAQSKVLIDRAWYDIAASSEITTLRGGKAGDGSEGYDER